MRNIIVLTISTILVGSLAYTITTWIDVRDRYCPHYLDSTKPSSTIDKESATLSFADSKAMHVDRHFIQTRDGIRLEVQSVHAESVPSVADIVLIHGYQSCKEDMLGSASWLVQRGFNVWIPDLRAHGGSEGTNTTFGILEHEDLVSLIDTIESASGTRPLVLWGNSMGGATAIMTAAIDSRVTVCISESAFSTRHSLLLHFIETEYPEDSWLEHQLGTLAVMYETGVSLFADDPMDLIARVKCPTLLMHGTNDQRVPFSAAQNLIGAAGSSVRLVPIDSGTHHNLRATNSARYDSAVKATIEPVLKRVP